MGKKCPECKAGVPLWVLTYGDTMSLLLCFFILLLSFANMDQKKFNAMSGSIKQALGGLQTPEPGNPSGMTLFAMDFHHHVQLVETMQRIQVVMKETVDNGDAEVTEEDSGFVLRIDVDALLKPDGSFQLKPDMVHKLSEVASIYQVLPNIIEITGFTDGSPGQMKGFPYQNKWLLSAAPASVVADFLVTAGGIDPSQIEVRGLGELFPVASNATPEGQKANRRVEILFSYRTKGVIAPPQEETPPQPGTAEPGPG